MSLPDLTAAGAASPDEGGGLALITFRVFGLSDAHLHEYVEDLRAREADPNLQVVGRRRRHGSPGQRSNRATPTEAAAGTTARARADQLHHIRSVEELGFALVAEHAGLGAWGRSMPVQLVRKAQGEDGVYIGQAAIPVDAIHRYATQEAPPQQRLNGSSGTPLPPMTCRLVIVKRSLLVDVPPAVQACPGACILAVDSAHTKPREVQLRPHATPTKVSLAATGLVDPGQVELLLQGSEAWEAIVDVGDTAHAQVVTGDAGRQRPRILSKALFRPAGVHFPFLRTLSRESPADAQARGMAFTPDTGNSNDGGAAAATPPPPQRGPMLSLTLYGSDPRQSYSRDGWLASLPAAMRAAVEAEDEAAPPNAAPLRTVPFEVSRVRPVRMEGSCWCETVLPAPAPLKKRLDEERQQRPASRLVSPATASVGTHAKIRHSGTSSVASYCGSCASSSTEGVDAEARGWCLRPLTRAQPVAGPALDVSRTQHLWHCAADLASLENQAIEVEVQVPPHLLPPNLRPESSSSPVCGTTVLVSSMFTQGTHGVLQVSVPCQVPQQQQQEGFRRRRAGSSPALVWVFLYVHYLFIFPYNHDNNDLRVVRSAETYAQLTVPTLVGHRGLGKTYTRRGGAPRERATSKLAENSIESLNAAHRRGCAMVEFDVMLTLDRIPVIFHDPILMLHALEKRREAPAAATLANGSSDDEVEQVCGRPGADGDGAALMSCRGAVALSRLQRMYLQRKGSYVPIPVAIHSLTKRQLDLLVTESFSFGAVEPPKLKVMILRHWLQILRISRNRARLQYLRENAIRIRPTDEDEFRGCGGLATGAVVAAAALQGALQSGGGGEGGGGGGNFLPAVVSALSASGAGGADVHAARYHDPIDGIVPSLHMYRQQLRRANRMLDRQEDITNRIPAFRDLFLLTPPSLSLNIEVKYPFMPRWDANLFQQSDAFEINGFVDAILDVVFAFAEEGRQIAFSSFEPDICVALATKQSRYDVLFLSDTEERVDLKDYRSFYVEGAIQFAAMHHLAGVSISAATLPLVRRSAASTAEGAAETTESAAGEWEEEEGAATSSAIASKNKNSTVDTGSCTADAALSPQRLLDVFDTAAVVAGMAEADEAGASSTGELGYDRVPLVSELVFKRKCGAPADAAQMEGWYDWTAGEDIVDAAHRRGLKVWTWGDVNSDLFLAYMQGVHMGVDAIITDNVPV